MHSVLVLIASARLDCGFFLCTPWLCNTFVHLLPRTASAYFLHPAASQISRL